MSERAERKPQITIKRKVAVKAVITDQFKDFLRLELKETVRAAKARIEDIDNHIKLGDKVATLLPQLLGEKQQLQFTIEHEATQAQLIGNLENGAFFSQGHIEGFVTVSEGDNLYEKIGGMEVVVKDGVIQKINALTLPSQLSL